MTGTEVVTARETLAERKQGVTREAIVNAVARAICEVGFDFSMQDVADRAGVTHRTVYRYFETREALLAAAHQWQDERLQAAGTTMPNSVAGIPEAVERLFRAFDGMPDLTRAAALIALTRDATHDAAHKVEAPWRNERTDRLRNLFEATFPHLAPGEAARAFAVIRTLAGSIGWFVLSSEFGLRGDESGPAVRRALEVLIADLYQRDAAAAAASETPHDTPVGGNGANHNEP